MKKEYKKILFFKKQIRSILGRLGIALVALSLVAVLILWDSGIIELPFLVRSERRGPITETEEETKTEVLDYIDYKSFGEKVLFSVYSSNAITDIASLYTEETFNRETMSLVKSSLVGADYETAYGYLIKNSNGKIFSLPGMTEIPGSENYEFSFLVDLHGNAIFQKKDDKSYYIWDSNEKKFVATEFDPIFHSRGTDLVLPKEYGIGEENRTLIYENGLFGYKGSYKDGRKTKEFTVDPAYPTAFRYSEGFAVMADANGRITIRNEKGDMVFGNLDLLMTDKTGEEALGFHYFDHGLLRVVIASYDENGNIKSKRESIINTYGEEVFLPQNYHAVSYLEGIFVVTNGEKFGYVSSNGAWITSPVYDHASPFCEGIAVVTNEDGKKGLIDQTGKVILEPAFDGISSFSAGSALLYSQDLGWYLLSKVKGKFPPSENTEPPTSSEFHTKITITRGPQNTFDYEPDEIIVLPPILSTPYRTTHPSYTAKK